MKFEFKKLFIIILINKMSNQEIEVNPELKENYYIRVDASKQRIASRAYYERNKEKILARQKERYINVIKPKFEANKEEISQKRKEYYQKLKAKRLLEKEQNSDSGIN